MKINKIVINVTCYNCKKDSQIIFNNKILADIHINYLIVHNTIPNNWQCEECLIDIGWI